MRLPRHAETRCAIDKFTHGIYLSEATSAQALQPDLIGVFRIFAGARVFIAAFFLLAATLALGRVMLFAFLPLVTSIALLAFVMSRRLQARLGPWHMKLAGLFATADVLLTTDFYMRWSIAHWIFPAAHMPDVPQFIKSLTSIAFAFDQGTPPISPLLVTISLLVLLIIISWRQELRYSITYIVVTTAIDIGIMLVVSSGLVQIAFNLAVIFLRIVVFCVLTAVITYLVKIQNRQHNALLAANAKLVRYVAVMEELTISHERNRLARELHDTLAHTLSAASVQLEAANSLWTNDRDTSHMALTQAMKITRSGLSETRRALKALRASPLDDLGLELALKELGEVTRQRSGATVSILMPDLFEPLPAEIEQTLYRAAQEAFENIVRHARATHVDLSLTHVGSAIKMKIQDNGVGFDVTSAQRKPEHFGLNGLTERIEALGGRVTISSQPNTGTCIAMEITAYDDSRAVMR